MKKSFSLLITLLVLNIFSILSIYIIQTKSIKSKNLQNQYLYIQAKNHINFFEDYLRKIDLKNIQKLKIDDEIFNIYANIHENKINIFVKSKKYNINLYKSIKK